MATILLIEDDGELHVMLSESLTLAGHRVIGSLAKYNPPIVASGSVYVPSFSHYVSVYRNVSTTEAPLGGVAWTIPGTIEAEKFDTGGSGVAYADSDAGNNGGQFRTRDDVDIEATTDIGGGFNVGWSNVGEWTKYSVNVSPSASSYTFGVRVAAIDIDFDGIVDIIAASGGNNKSTVNIYSGADHTLLRTFSAIPGTPNSALFTAGTAVSPVVQTK